MIVLRVCAYTPRHTRHYGPAGSRGGTANTKYKYTHEPPLSSVRPSGAVTAPHSAYTLGGNRYYQNFMRGRQCTDLAFPDDPQRRNPANPPSVTVTLICLRRNRDPLQGRGFDVLVVHRPTPLPYQDRVAGWDNTIAMPLCQGLPTPRGGAFPTSVQYPQDSPEDVASRIAYDWLGLHLLPYQLIPVADSSVPGPVLVVRLLEA